jgi:hypothetical protein
MAKKEQDVSSIMKKLWVSSKDLVTLGVAGSVKTLDNKRSSGKELLPHTKFGRSIRYKLKDVLEYLEKNNVMPKAE